MASRQQWDGKKLQLHGYVVPDSIMRKPQTRWTSGSRCRATARRRRRRATPAIVPDTFKSEAEVVLKGTLSRRGLPTQPNGVMAKCPSKYAKAAAQAGEA